VRSFTPEAPSTSTARDQDRTENAPRHGHSRKSKPSSALPAPLRRYTPQENYWIILAYREHILQQGPHLVAQEQPPSPLLFETFKVIHMASHGPTATPWEAVLHPQAALFLLREYLDLHPQLRTALNAAIVRGSGAMRWSTPTIQHPMLNVGDLFLRYHGLRRGQGLSVSIRPPWKEQSAGNFEFAVRLQPEILLGTNDGLVSTREEAQQAATALAWCLQALFAYAPDLGLKTAPFW
jgi:hypothetical protein